MRKTDSINHRKPKPFSKGIILATLVCGIFFCFTACEDDPILQPTDSTGAGGSYGKFEEPDSLHLLFDQPNPETF